MEGQRTHTSPRRGHARPLALLALWVLAVYLNSTRGGLVWDDVLLVTGLRSAPKNKTTGALLGYWSQHRRAQTPGYYPAREWSLALDRRLWGKMTAGYHITNVALHLAASLLLYGLAAAVTGRRGLALALAALWAAHPAATECADWLKNRSILLCAVASLGAVAAVAATRASGWRRTVAGAVGACALAAGLFCKELAVVAPVLGVWVAAASPRLSLRRLRWPLAGLWAVLALYVAMKVLAFEQARELARPPRKPGKPGLALRVAKTYWAYGVVSAAPFGLCADRELDSPLHASGAALLATCCVLAWAGRRRRWLIALGLGWLVIGLLPASNIIYLSDRPIAEQRMYLALPGVCAVWAAVGWPRRWLLAGLLAALASLTIGRHFVWADNHALWTATVPAAPAKARTWLNLGNYYLEAGRYGAAERCERRAVQLDRGWASAWQQLGRARYGQGDVAGAAVCFEQTLLRARRPDAHFDLAGCYAKLGRLDDALAQCQRALRLEPGFTDARVRMALVYMAKGDADASGRVLEEAVRLDPKSAWAWFELGNHHFVGRRFAEALECYAAAREAGGKFAGLWLNTGKVLQILGRSEDAVRAFDRSLAAAPESWEAWQGRGAAAESKGDWAAAARCYRQALRLNPQASVARDRLGALERGPTPRP